LFRNFSVAAVVVSHCRCNDNKHNSNRVGQSLPWTILESHLHMRQVKAQT